MIGGVGDGGFRSNSGFGDSSPVRGSDSVLRANKVDALDALASIAWVFDSFGRPPETVQGAAGAGSPHGGKLSRQLSERLVSHGSGTAPDIEALVCEWAPEWPCSNLQATIGPESGWRVDAVNPSGQYCGLLQVWNSETGGHRWPCAWLLVAENNIRAGYELWLHWRDRGFDPLTDPWPNSP